MHMLKIPEQKTGSFYLQEQRVTWTKSAAPLQQKLGAHFAEFSTAYDLLHKKPRAALKKSKNLHALFPSLPDVALLHAYALIINRKTKKADQIIHEAHLKNPDHLLLRINYGDQLLRQKKLEALSALFSDKTDLRALYPDKKTFHITEFRGFITLMGHYHLAKGDQQAATCYHYLATRVDPKHPSTQCLGAKLYPKATLLQRLKNKM